MRAGRRASRRWSARSARAAALVVGGDPADGGVGLDEDGLAADQPTELVHPLLEGDLLVAAPVDDGGRAPRPRRACAGSMAMMSSSWIGLNRLGRSGCTGIGGAGQDALEVEGRPAAVVAVGHVEPGDGRRQAELAGLGAHDGLGRDLGDRVGRHHHAVVVAERIGLGDWWAPGRLVHAGRRAVQEGGRAGGSGPSAARPPRRCRAGRPPSGWTSRPPGSARSRRRRAPRRASPRARSTVMQVTPSASSSACTAGSRNRAMPIDVVVRGQGPATIGQRHLAGRSR